MWAKRLKRLLRKRHNRWLAGVGAVAVATFLLGAFAQSKTQRPLELKYAPKGQGVGEPLKIRFTQELQPGFNYNLVPGTAGRWHEERGLFGVSALVFTPDQPLRYGQSYLVQLSDVRRAITRELLPDHLVRVVTEIAPDIVSFTPADETKGVPVDVELRLKLKPGSSARPEIKLIPEVSLELAESDSDYVWRPRDLRQGTKYEVAISNGNESDPEKRQLYSSSFTTVAEPKVVEATQTDHFYLGAVIKVVFDQAMERSEEALRFEVPGVGGWRDDRTYEFVPRDLKPDTAYAYTVLAGAKSADGGRVETDQRYSIKTPGQIYLNASSPSGASAGTSEAISATFDQPVDKASAEAAFSIAPKVNGSFSWEENRLTFKPASLDNQTTYIVSFAAGVKAVYGLPNAKLLSFQFTTVPKTVKLNVPYYKQQYYLSCEEAALRMALAYRGIYTNDMEIVQRVGYNPRPRDTVTNTWDDPYQMFVGDINGIQGKTGYGVFAEPIAKAARTYGRDAASFRNVSAKFLAEQIHAGHPVVIWGYWNKAPANDVWNLPGGGQVNGYYGEHARTLIGVTGRADSPVGFYIHDPLDGSVGEYWTAAQLMAHMNAVGSSSNQAVVLY